MIDITSKSNSLRKAVAAAIVKLSDPEAMRALQNNSVPKGNVFEMARTAGLFAVKKTSEMIPDCHPVPVEYTAINFETSGLEIRIIVEVHTIYKTGVEVEAMHGASIVALTIYDMLKPIDKRIEIASIHLVKKSGGRSSTGNSVPAGFKAAVVICSDSVYAGKKQDSAGRKILDKLNSLGVDNTESHLIPDDPDEIRKILTLLKELETDLIIFTGGTGLSARDVTPETIRPMLDREIPGIMEAARTYGQQRTPYAMLSRGIAGMYGESLVLTLPGSVQGASESMDAVFPSILHVFSVKSGQRHDVPEKEAGK